MSQTAIPYMQIRGGSSKGLYFHAADLPTDIALRDQVLLSAMGRDDRQIDGLGGADPLTSKVAVVGLSERDDADIDYLFLQVVVGEERIDSTPNCGNILAGVGPFCLESSLIEGQPEQTRIRAHLVNSGKICELVLQTPEGSISYEGDARIDGVPGTSAPIVCNYMDVAGSACGSLLPTGNLIDVVDDVEITCIDNGMPVVLLRASDLGISGEESPDQLNSNEVLKQKLQSIRLQIGPKMNLGDVDGAAVPKMCLISAPKSGGVINTRTFIPYKCHSSIGVLGAVSVATGCILPGSVATGIAQTSDEVVSDITGTDTTGSHNEKSNSDGPLNLSVEHPCGEFSVSLDIDNSSDIPAIKKVGLLRTARLLSRGDLFISPQ